MSNAPRIAFLTTEIPTPGQAGYLTHNYRYLELFDRLGLDVTLVLVRPRLPRIVFRVAEILPFRRIDVVGPEVRKLGDWVVLTRPYTVARALSRAVLARLPGAMRRALDRTQRRARGQAQVVLGVYISAADAAAARAEITRLNPDFVFVDTLFLAEAARDLPPGIRTVLLTHDIFFERVASFRGQGIEVAPIITQAEEMKALAGFDTVVAVNPSDAETLRRLLPPQTDVISVVTPVTAAAPVAGTVRDPDLAVFVGSGAAHNVDGLVWLLDAIWPAIRAACPTARLDVYGTVCERLGRTPPAGVVLRGRVDDLAQHLPGAAVALNPLRAGSGLKIKVLDYLASGVPCVMTTIGAQGFERTGAEPFVVTDEAADFAAAVVRFLTDADYAAAMAARTAPFIRSLDAETQFAPLRDRLLAPRPAA